MEVYFTKESDSVSNIFLRVKRGPPGPGPKQAYMLTAFTITCIELFKCWTTSPASIW